MHGITARVVWICQGEEGAGWPAAMEEELPEELLLQPPGAGCPGGHTEARPKDQLELRRKTNQAEQSLPG